MVAALLLAALAACAAPGGGEAPEATPAAAPGFAGPVVAREAVDSACVLPGAPRVLRREGGAVLQAWRFELADVHRRPVVPADSGFLAYRAAVRHAGADVRWPAAATAKQADGGETSGEADQAYNNRRVAAGDVGRIEPVTCLDALLFSVQNARVPQLDRPTEFIASVLRRPASADARRPELLVLFGAGEEMFPPKSVYGFDVVEAYLARGWTWWYVLHNHTLQEGQGGMALGTPAPSTSDVQLLRGLVDARGLEEVRVTNGFYTFRAAGAELAALRSP